ncbi:hypothetical protein GCM10011506_03930 [Marivirga lumbricoides]|uniref:DUF4440 domain-containing protein n=1 Tax=Marivirga lumbricoides TaxID=1046115 RepID=A0ABQ1LDV8_9BACT|nr:hypothetical protein GCM10011506_03930 [Marivirga lumbricoides]
MNKQFYIFLIFLTFCYSYVINAQDTDIQEIEIPVELQNVLTDYEMHWRAFNAEALAELFTEDGFILRPGREAVRGKDKIASAYKGSGGPLYLSAYAYEKSENIAFIVGGYRATEEGTDGGKFTLTLKKVDGVWKIFSDMDNGNSR